jgi:HSP20 family protein
LFYIIPERKVKPLLKSKKQKSNITILTWNRLCLFFCQKANPIARRLAMELMKWNPMREMDTLRERMNSLYDSFFSRRSETEEGLWGWNPAVDVYEDDSKYVVKAELPGVDKEDIQISLVGRILSLKGERSDDKEIKDDKVYRRECSYGRFERSFALPSEVDPDSIKAEYKDGVLKIEVPVPEERKPKQISVR